VIQVVATPCFLPKNKSQQAKKTAKQRKTAEDYEKQNFLNLN